MNATKLFGPSAALLALFAVLAYSEPPQAVLNVRQAGGMDLDLDLDSFEDDLAEEDSAAENAVDEAADDVDDLLSAADDAADDVADAADEAVEDVADAAEDVADAADDVRRAVTAVLNEGWRTPDIADRDTPSERLIGTERMGDLVVDYCSRPS